MHAAAPTLPNPALPSAGPFRLLWLTAARRLRAAGSSYMLDPHLAADTGLAEVHVPLFPQARRPQGGTSWTA
jgi:hypothetical protein